LPVTLGMRVGRAVFKKGSILRAVDMPPHSPHALHPSTFRAPGWGAPVLPSSCCRSRSATPRGLVLFRHRSASRIFITQPGCNPSPMVIQDDDHQLRGGEKQAGLRPPPHPQLQGCSSSGLGRGGTPSWGLPPRGLVTRFFLRHSGEKDILQLYGGGVLRQRGTGRPQASSAPACLARWLSWLWRGLQPCLLPLGPGVVVRPPHGRLLRRAHRGIVQDVVRRAGGVRVLGLSCPHSGTSPPRGGRCLPICEDLSGDLPVQAGAATIRRRGAGVQVAVVVGAEVVVARGGFSADETVGATCGRTSGSLALMACLRPSCGDVGEGLFPAAFALRSSLLLFSRPKRRSLSLLMERSPASHPEFVIPQAL
jgi:hypothetical protein